ncbi:MAG: NHL repeat-containing protein, partial [Terracidiphilus sp.]
MDSFRTSRVSASAAVKERRRQRLNARTAFWAVLTLLPFAPHVFSQGAAEPTSYLGPLLGGGFASPTGVAVDVSGNVYVADKRSGLVTEMPAGCASSSCLTVLGGDTFKAPSGVAVDNSGNVYVADPGNGSVYSLTPNCLSSICVTGLGGTAFSLPNAVAVDRNSNLYIIDGPSVFTMVSTCTSSSCVTQVGGGFGDHPQGVAVDRSGNVYVADAVSQTVYVFAPDCTSLSCVGVLGGGFVSPTAVAVDANERIYVVDNGTNLDVMPPNCTSASCVAAVAGGLNQPNGVAVDSSGNVYVADSVNTQIREFVRAPANAGSVAVQTGKPASLTVTVTFLTGGTIEAPAVLTWGAAGLDFADAGTGSCTTNGTSYSYNAGDSCTVMVNFAAAAPGPRYGAAIVSDSSGTVIATANIYGAGTGPQVTFPPGTQSTLATGPNAPAGVVVDAKGDSFISSPGANAVVEIPAGSSTQTTITTSIASPLGLAMDGSGDLFVADGSGVYKIEAVNGAVSSTSTAIQLPIPLDDPQGTITAVAVDGGGNLFCAESDSDSSTGEVTESFAPEYTTTKRLGFLGEFQQPDGLALDGSGNLYVADKAFGVIELLAPSYSAGNQPISTGANGIAVDAAGDIYISAGSNSVNSYVSEYSPSNGFSQPIAQWTGYNNPRSLALDGSGRIYIADQYNNALAEIDPTTASSLRFATTNAGATSTGSPQTVTVQNIGNQNLNITAVNFPTDFPEAAGQAADCTSSTSVPAASSCTLTIDFSPLFSSLTGPSTSLSEQVSLSDNDLNRTNVAQSVAVSGTETAPPATQLVFGLPPAANVAVGGNAGSAVTVQEEDSAGEVAPWATDSITLTVTYPDSTTQIYNQAAVHGVATFNLGSVALTETGNYTYTAGFGVLSNTVASETVVSSAYTAPSSTVGAISSVQTATLALPSNFTLGSIDVLTQGAPNLDFQLAAGGTCMVNAAYTAGQACTVNYTFNPTHPGPRNGAVLLFDNQSPSNAVVTVYLQGTGNGPQIVFPSNAARSTLSTAFLLPTGVAVDGAGNTFVCDSSSNEVKEIVAAGGYSTVNTVSYPSGPFGVAVDGAGNIFVASANSNVVKEVFAASNYTTSTTVTSGFSPYGVALDGAGNLYVTDDQNGAVKEISAASGYTNLTTLASGFNHPYGVAVDGSGNVFVADTGNNAVKEIVAAGGYTTVNTLGTGFDGPTAVAVDAAGDVVVADTANGMVKEIMAAGGYTTVATVAAGFNSPQGVALDAGGNIIVSDSSDHAVIKLDLIDPPSLGFPLTPAGQISGSQTVTVQNGGNQPLAISNILYGTDFPEAAGVGTDCSISVPLAAGSTCTLSIDFSPLLSSATGSSTPLSESVSLTDNNLNGTGEVQSVAVIGTEVFMAPSLSTPTPGTILPGSTATFTWNPGAGATKFRLRLGTTSGASDVYSGVQTTGTSAAVTSLPTAGGQLYASLDYLVGSTWSTVQTTYTAASPSALVSPAPNSTLSGSSVTFSWSPGADATLYRFRVGTSLGAMDLYNGPQTTDLSAAVTGLPAFGVTLYARLYSQVSGVWITTDYTYTEAG